MTRSVTEKSRSFRHETDLPICRLPLLCFPLRLHASALTFLLFRIDSAQIFQNTVLLKTVTISRSRWPKDPNRCMGKQANKAQSVVDASITSVRSSGGPELATFRYWRSVL